MRCKSSLARAIVFRGEAVEESPATSEFEVQNDLSLLLAYLTALHTQKNYPVSSALLRQAPAISKVTVSWDVSLVTNLDRCM